MCAGWKATGFGKEILMFAKKEGRGSQLGKKKDRLGVRLGPRCQKKTRPAREGTPCFLLRGKETTAAKKEGPGTETCIGRRGLRQSRVTAQERGCFARTPAPKEQIGAGKRRAENSRKNLVDTKKLCSPLESELGRLRLVNESRRRESTEGQPGALRVKKKARASFVGLTFGGP